MKHCKFIVCVVALIMIGLTNSYAVGNLKFIKMGFKGGVTINDMRSIKAPGNVDVFTKASQSGYHLGLQSRINFLGVYVQPELLYSHNNYHMTIYHNTEVYKTTLKFNNLDMPVLIGGKFLFFRIYVGPVFNLMSENGISLSDGLVLATKINSNSISYLTGLGVDMSHFTLDIAFRGNFSSPKQVLQLSSGDNVSFKSSRSSWYISLGFLF